MGDVRRRAAVNSIRLAVVSALLTLQPIAAWAESGGVRYQVEQPAQPLAEALKAIARQTFISVLFDPAAVANRVSRPISGAFSGAEAISRVLEGTELTHEVTKDGAIVVKPKAKLNQSVAPTAQVLASYEANEVKGASSVQLAQAPEGQQRPSDASSRVAASERDGERQQLAKVEITGSRIKRVETESALPVSVYTREDIERSGQPDVGRFLSTLNEVSMTFSGGNAGGGLTVARQSTVQLRGLPAGATLVLINGRRVQPGSTSTNAAVFNLNLIPIALVERIEIVPVGSSAVYGGDALAGVVNIILKKSIDGVAADARYGWADGTEDRSASLGAGGSTDRASFMALATYSKTTPLHATERDFFVNADYRRFGGTDQRIRACTPGTVSSTTAANLPGLTSTFAGIPVTSTGQTLTIGSFTGTAGQANLCGPSANANGIALIYGSETIGLHSSAEYWFGSSWAAFGELSYSNERYHSPEQGILLNNVLVPAANLYNPFGVPVRVTTRLGRENGLDGVSRETDFTRAVAGLRGEIWRGWDVSLSIVSSRDKSAIRNFNLLTNTTAQAAALASTNPTTALNPFATGRATSDDVLRGIYSDSLPRSHGERDLVSVAISGSALDLPAGPLDLAVGAESSREDLTNRSGLTTVPDTIANRRFSAGFVEARLPLVAGVAEGGRKFEMVALTLAGRSDRYSDFGSKSTYQTGLEVRPQRTLLLRAATATAFKPPSLVQLGFPARAPAPLSIFGLTDPARGGTPITTGEALIGPTPGLRAETGNARAIGAAWEPDILSGFRIAVTDWSVELRNMIAIPAGQTLLNFEAQFPGAVTRGPTIGGVPGQVQSIRLGFYNLGQVDIAGTDLNAGMSIPTPVGDWNLVAGATRTRKYEVVIAPGAPTQDRLSRQSSDAWAPKWKANLGVGLSRWAWTFNVAGRYLGSYKDAGTSTRELGDYWTTDIAVGIDLKKLDANFLGSLRETKITLSVANVGNKLPEFVAASPFYDITQGDWRGRYASLRGSARW